MSALPCTTKSKLTPKVVYQIITVMQKVMENLNFHIFTIISSPKRVYIELTE